MKTMGCVGIPDNPAPKSPLRAMGVELLLMLLFDGSTGAVTLQKSLNDHKWREKVVKVLCDHDGHTAAAFYTWFKIRDGHGTHLVKIKASPGFVKLFVTTELIAVHEAAQVSRTAAPGAA